MERKFAMVFVTLNKSDKDYSPSTLYEDYAISPQQFHWQSMNKVRKNSEEGLRISEQRTNGWKYLLTSSLRTPKIFIKEFGDFLMSCHQHCLGVNLLVQR